MTTRGTIKAITDNILKIRLNWSDTAGACLGKNPIPINIPSPKPMKCSEVDLTLLLTSIKTRKQQLQSQKTNDESGYAVDRQVQLAMRQATQMPSAPANTPLSPINVPENSNVTQRFVEMPTMKANKMAGLHMYSMADSMNTAMMVLLNQ